MHQLLTVLNIKVALIKFIQTYLKQYNLPLIPFLLEGVALKPDLNLSDGMHPNEKGTIIISKTLREMILKDISSN